MLQGIYSTMMNATLTIPCYEVIGILLLVMFCFLFQSPKIGLLLCFFFVFRLGWAFWQDNFAPDAAKFLIWYGILGLFAFFAALHAFWFEK